MTGNPYPAPAPLVLADQCARAAWVNHIDDNTRMLLEWAADTIREQAAQNLVLSHKAEQLEGDCAHLFHLHYGSTRGGAA